MKRPWGVHTIYDIYHPGVQAEIAYKKWAIAIPEPYASNVLERLRAAWWVLTGSAHAFIWPKAGDLEKALSEEWRDKQRAKAIAAAVAAADGSSAGK